MAHAPVAVTEFSPEPGRGYLVFCPDHGGWQVGEWWEVDGPGRWVLSWDLMVELKVSHVLALPETPVGAVEAAARNLSGYPDTLGRA